MDRQNQEIVPPLNQPECYNAAVQFHNHEFRTLGERTNLLVIAQSIFIGAFVFVLSGQEKFHYVLPYVLTAIVLVGSAFCFLHHLAGRKGARSAFTWKQYMREIERGSLELPWQWYYNHYRDVENRGVIGCDYDLLSRLPLPSTWLAIPTIFLAVWFIVSLYIPSRIIFDSGFAPDSCRPLALVLSITAALGVLVSLLFVICRIRLWWSSWKL